MLTALLIAYSVVASNPADLIDRDLRRAGNEYAYGNYEEAILQLRELLYPVKLVTEEQVMEARELLALCYYLTNRIEQMGTEFSKLLYSDPDYELDPFTVAPAVIEKFEQIRDRLAPDLDKLRRAQQGNPVRTAPGPTVLRTVEQTVIYRSDFATFLPFGIGQFQNGDVQMGLILASPKRSCSQRMSAPISWHATVLSRPKRSRSSWSYNTAAQHFSGWRGASVSSRLGSTLCQLSASLPSSPRPHSLPQAQPFASALISRPLTCHFGVTPRLRVSAG